MLYKKIENTLTFSGPMPYYKDKVYEFNLPAGHTCPQANECLMKANRVTGKMENGPAQRFRCYAAAAERFPAVRDARWRNLETLKSSNCWIKRIDEITTNLILQASRGGKKDSLIDQFKLKSATVFRTLEEALESGLPIDVDDTYACSNQGSFALVDNFGPDHGGRILITKSLK